MELLDSGSSFIESLPFVHLRPRNVCLIEIGVLLLRGNFIENVSFIQESILDPLS